jgi:two-component system cell cycle response regulator
MTKIVIFRRSSKKNLWSAGGNLGKSINLARHPFHAILRPTMSGGLADELHDVSRDKDNQDLKEILEIALQITAQLDVESILKNMAWSFVAKFQTDTVTLLLPGDINENEVQVYHFKGSKRESLDFEIPPLAKLLAFLDKDEYNQIPFSYFRDNYSDPALVEKLEALCIDVMVPLRTDKGVIGLLLLPKNGVGRQYGLQDLQYITDIARFAAIAVENSSLFHQATTDRMTGLYSHHFFEKTLEEELERARRYKTSFSLVMFDIDHFKRFNDTYGHLQGDKIIREVARLLTRSIRQVDIPARYGGEEFAVILPSVDAKGALIVAERLRKTVGEYGFQSEEKPLHVTISVGIVQYNPEIHYAVTEIIRSADKALYQSKERGRNRVSVSSDS